VTWTPLDRGGDYQGTLVARTGWRGPIDGNPWPAPFGPANLGTASSAYEFTSWNNDFEIEDLFWEQRIGPTFSFRVGNQGPQTTINTFRFKDARTSFTGSPYAFSETIPYPAFGAGVSFRWRPIEDSGLFVNGVLNDMNGNPSQGSLNWSHLQIGQLFAGIEVGKQWQRENGEYDQLALDVFNAGTRSIFSPTTTPNKAGGGFKILGEKQWGPIVGFANYTFNTAKGGGISTTFSNNTAVAGVALLRPFGIVGEAAVAGMWSLPFKDLLPGVSQRAQYEMETYWNIGLTPNTTITPGIQLIFDPSFNPRVNFIAIPDVKYRIAI
jgi:Carbohydrate-selective porin, OprB family